MRIPTQDLYRSASNLLSQLLFNTPTCPATERLSSDLSGPCLLPLLTELCSHRSNFCNYMSSLGSPGYLGFQAMLLDVVWESLEIPAGG